MTPTEAVQSLLKSGWTEKRIADAVGSNQPTINRIKHGRIPRGWKLGTGIIRLASTPPPQKREVV